LLQQENYSVEQVASLVKKDPALAANLIQVANSPLFRPACPIQEIEDAIVRLGRNSVVEIIYTAIGKGYFQDKIGSGLVYRQHSVGCGGILKELSSRIFPELAGGAFICGLFHDLGKLVFLHLGEELYKTSLDGTSMRRAGELAREERKNLGYDHAVLGGLLLESWIFCEPFPAVITLHHRQPESFKPEPLYLRVALLVLADALEPAVARADKEEYLDEIEKQSQLVHFIQDITGRHELSALLPDWFDILSEARKKALEI